MRNKVIWFVIFFFHLVFCLNAQHEVKWHTLEEAEKLCKEKPKMLLVDFYTDWCGWCKKMDATTFKHPEVVAYLNRYFYAVKFDAETKDTITYLDTAYVNRGTGRRATHDLAIKLLEGRLTYPSTLFMDKNVKPITVVPGFREAKEMLSILVFLNEGVYKTNISFQDFDKYFKETYPDNQQYAMAKSVVKWYTLEEALKLSKEKPKKIFIDVHVNWQIGCTMMMMTTYNHPEIGAYLNEKYYPVRIDALTRDTIHFGRDYINAGSHPSYHQLPAAMLEGNMKFPVALYLDENQKLINRIQTYLTPEAIEPMLKYFGEDAYKTESWKDYSEKFESSLNKKNQSDSKNTKE